jgi:predicted alternative tryptophan synthase beta-subunit
MGTYKNNKYRLNKYTIKELENEMLLDILQNNLMKVDWICISKYQDLSEEFLEKYSNKVSWYWIIRRQNLSDDFKNKYKVFIK